MMSNMISSPSLQAEGKAIEFNAVYFVELLRRTLRAILAIMIILTTSPSWANDHIKLKTMSWPFEGILGQVDRQAAQRGFQVYKEVCAACHSMHQLSYRNLTNLGFSEAEVKEIAKSFTVHDGPNDQGEMFDRPGIPSDKFVSPFANVEAAKAANNGAAPPDLSLIIKAREDGANYVHSLLTGYDPAPDGFKMMPGLYYNSYFHGHQIAMPSPLSDGQVQYMDGTNASVDQMSRDLVVFLQWAAEPEMERRKSMGLKVTIFLVIFSIVFYVAKGRVWARLDEK
jgi:ubiquinol-cytochrome c reductase cytochrome c1 subunit